jgi:ATP-dependent DNA ligase
LHHNGRDLRELPLIERKAGLEKLIGAANSNWLRYSEHFNGCSPLPFWIPEEKQMVEYFQPKM